MGKTKRPKRRNGTGNPIGVPNMNQEFGLNHPGGQIASINEQLQSVNAEEKLNGLQALSFMCQFKQKLHQITDGDVVRITATLLMDPNTSVRNAASSALRTLSLNGVEICENLVEQDVLTPLLALLNEYAVKVPEWVPIFDVTVNNQMDEQSDTFLHAINLVWNLCESTDMALEHFNQTGVLQSFVRCLDFHIFGMEIAITVAQCLLVISEDNLTAWRVLQNFGQDFSTLLAFNEPTQGLIYLQTLVAGVMANIPILSNTYLKAIFSTISVTIDQNHRQALASLTSNLPLQYDKEIGHALEIEDDSVAMEEETEMEARVRRRKQDLPSEIEIQIQHVGWLLEAQRVAAEVITNLCSVDDDANPDDPTDNSDAESVHDYDVSSFNSSSSNLQSDRLSIELLEPIKSFGVVEKLWQRSQPIAENVNDILKESERSLLSKYNSLRISSLLCLQNLCNLMSSEDLGGPSAIYSVWLDVGQQVFQGTQNPFILEASTSLMRAALNHLRNSPQLFNQMTENDLQLMLNGVNNCTEPEVRANWLRMLGGLGCLLPEILVKQIIDFIINACLKENDVWTISEAMDSLMDMFSDNDWDQLCFELKVAQKIKELEKLLKNRLRQQKRELGDRYVAVCTVRTNLSRFCKYIESQQKKLKTV